MTMSDLHRYKMICIVSGATQADVDRWLANYAKGRHATLVRSTKVDVYLDDERDRIALRGSFDVEKVQFVAF
jgi:hypothetical protein